jgi:hypothetical protein
LANESGVGVGDLSKITVIGEEIEHVRIKFKPHSNYELIQKKWVNLHPGYVSR